MKRVLFVGESWHVHTVETKGFDVFSYDYYEEAVEYIREAIEYSGWEFVHIPSHLVERDFPKSTIALSEFNVVMFSDVGANTMNIPMNVFMKSIPNPNKLELLREYVVAGGAFVMIGGYLSFMGIQGRGAYKHTPIEEILPVEMDCYDDRREISNGIIPTIRDVNHPVMKGIPEIWPPILGYNHLTAKQGTEIIATVNNDPLIVLGHYGKGRTCAYATDCSPHWSPLEFCSWYGYSIFWKNLLNWLSGKDKSI